MNESIAECTEALKLNENYLKALLKRASIYMELEEFEEAVRDLEKACKMDKNNSRGMNSLLINSIITYDSMEY